MASSPKYPLLPFAQFVYDSTRWISWACMFNVTMRTREISLIQAKDIAQKVLGNHPVFQSRIDWRGRQYATGEKVQLQGPYLNLKLWEEDGWLYIYITCHLVLLDGHSIYIIMDDIYRALKGKELEKDDYWEYVKSVEQHKLSPHYANSKAWLESEFADENVPVRPTIDRRCLQTILLPKVGLHKDDYSNIYSQVRQFLSSQYLTMDGFFSLCTALAIAEYCGTNEAALTWAYDGRERPEEQRIFGSLHRDIPFKISNFKFQISNNKSALIRQARNQIRSGIAHSDYPYTLIPPCNKRWNYAVNVLRVPDIHLLVEQFPIPIELVSFPAQKYAYAILDVEIHESEPRLEIYYRYSAAHYKESSIRRFASLVRKYAEWLLEK